MIKKLHKKLVALYTVTTGLILTIVVAGVLVVSAQEFHKKNLDSFQNDLFNLISRLQFGSTVSGTWLSQLEYEEKLIIHIEDNGIPLIFGGSWNPPTDRSLLVQRAKDQAALELIKTTTRPVSSSLLKSSVFNITGDHNDSYFGSVIVVPVKNGYQSLTLLSYQTPAGSEILRQGIQYAFLTLLGIAALFLVSWVLVGKSLKPIEESRRKQNEFIASASHELRAPLAVIRSSISAISAAPQKRETFMNNIDRECTRMAILVNDMLLLASADTRHFTVREAPLDTDTLLIGIYERFEPLFQKKGVGLRLDLPENPLPHISGDEARMEQVLSILLDNALTYTPSGKEVSLSGYAGRRSVSLAVSDQGCGIDDTAKKHIFDRFYRGDSSRTDKQHYGLGLSIAQELVHLHKGSITVTDSESGGACFTVRLPARSTESKTDSQRGSQEAG